MSESVRDASRQFVATYNEFVSRTCIEMCDESFEYKYRGEQYSEDVEEVGAMACLDCSCEESEEGD